MSIDNKRRLVPLKEIQQEQISWLWADRVPLGAVTLLEGDPGQSKSTLTYDLIARVTTGTPMPICEEAIPPAGVVLIQAEDHLRGTVKPALKAAGADLARVLVYERSRFQSDPFSLPEDLPLLANACEQVQAKLIVIDPLSAFLLGNPNSDQSVRQALSPLATFAEESGLAVIVARHLNKGSSSNPIYRGAGSIGIIALVRSALLVCSDPSSDDQYRHLLVQTKTNLSTASTLTYRTVKQTQGITIEWLGESTITARKLSEAGGAEQSRLQEAVEILHDILSENGQLHVPEIYHFAKRAGLCKRTLQRAKQLLGVKSEKIGSGWGSFWRWKLPENDQQAGEDPANPIGAQSA